MLSAWKKWRKFTERIGDFQARMVFSLLYYILITPLSVAVRLFADFLSERSFPKWESYAKDVDKLDDLKKQS